MTTNFPNPVDGDVQAHKMPAMTDSERQKSIDAISTRMRSIDEEGDENLQFEYDILRFAMVALTAPPAQLLRPVELPDETEMKWRDLALQFDGHRMQAISLLKMIINDAPDDQYLSVRNFLKSGPLPGEEVLRKRIAEIAEVQRLNATAQPKCQKCGDTGMADSGGTQPWGEQILIECDCATAQPVSDKPSLKAMMRALDAFYADESVPEAAMMKAFRILLADVMPAAPGGQDD